MTDSVEVWPDKKTFRDTADSGKLQHALIVPTIVAGAGVINPAIFAEEPRNCDFVAALYTNPSMIHSEFWRNVADISREALVLLTASAWLE